MSVFKVSITSGRPNSYLTQIQTSAGKHGMAQKVINYITSLQTGGELAAGPSTPPSLTLVAQGSETQASGTITMNTVVATNTATINVVVFTGVASVDTGNQFNTGGGDTAAATSLALAINNSVTALVSGYVTATSSAGVVTITSNFYGLAGNMNTLAATGSTIVASGARFTGGAVDPNAVVVAF